MNDEERKARQRKEFIHALAVYLVGNEAMKGISLQMETSSTVIKWATEWSEVRSCSPIVGYTSVEEAEKLLTNFLNQSTDGNSKSTTS
jgi:hypothetical protein